MTNVKPKGIKGTITSNPTPTLGTHRIPQTKNKEIIPNLNRGRTHNFEPINLSLFVVSMDIILMIIFYYMSCFA